MVVVVWYIDSVSTGDGCCKRKEGEQPIEKQNLSSVATFSGRKIHTHRDTNKGTASVVLGLENASFQKNSVECHSFQAHLV